MSYLYIIEYVGHTCQRRRTAPPTVDYVGIRGLCIYLFIYIDILICALVQGSNYWAHATLENVEIGMWNTKDGLVKVKVPMCFI